MIYRVVKWEGDNINVLSVDLSWDEAMLFLCSDYVQTNHEGAFIIKLYTTNLKNITCMHEPENPNIILTSYPPKQKCKKCGEFYVIVGTYL